LEGKGKGVGKEGKWRGKKIEKETRGREGKEGKGPRVAPLPKRQAWIRH